MIYSFLKTVSFILSKLFFRVKVYGKENLPAQGSFIIASNHTSNLDPVLVGCVCPRKVCYMAKEELFRNPFMAWLMKNLWVFPVKRNTVDLRAIKEAVKRLRRGEPMLMFPQGSRSNDLLEGTPQAGVGFFAAKLNIPVIPAFVRGADQALPKGAKFLRFNRIYVSFGRPVAVDAKRPYQEIARQVMAAIAATGK